jgi:hypothetical protein
MMACQYSINICYTIIFTQKFININVNLGNLLLRRLNGALNWRDSLAVCAAQNAGAVVPRRYFATMQGIKIAAKTCNDPFCQRGFSTKFIFGELHKSAAMTHNTVTG